MSSGTQLKWNRMENEMNTWNKMETENVSFLNVLKKLNQLIKLTTGASIGADSGSTFEYR
jgi:hypothetical protein